MEREYYIKGLENQIKVLQNKVADQERIINKLQQSETDYQINTLLTEIDDQDDKKLFKDAIEKLHIVNEKINKRSTT